MKLVLVFFTLMIVYFLFGCRVENTVEAKPSNIAITWDAKLPGLSQFTKSEVEKSMPSLSRVKDILDFCPKYAAIPGSEKAWVWVELISAMAKFESGWSPVSRMVEPASSFPTPDPITGRPVASEGLLQLSYQDSKWHKGCRFDWSKDKSLAAKDPRKTILNPEINIECGVKILARQIERRGLIVVPSGPYWSVIYNGKYSKLTQIRAMVKASPLCH